MKDSPSSNERAFFVESTHDGKAYLRIKCDRGPDGTCHFSLWQQPAQGVMWQWDGNIEQPTISPSINCQGGCGRHWVITKGVAHG